MKFSLSWHEECLKNFNKTLDQKNRELHNLQDQIRMMSIQANFRKLQIDTARKAGREDYDEERYLSHLNPLNPKRNTI